MVQVSDFHVGPKVSDDVLCHNPDTLDVLPWAGYQGWILGFGYNAQGVETFPCVCEAVRTSAEAAQTVATG